MPIIPGWVTFRNQGKDKDTRIQPRKPPTAEEMETLKLKKAWEVALGPVKGLPMTAIMMYMSSNSLQIFTIMTVFMAFKNPIIGLFSTNSAFEKFQTDNNAGKMLQVKALLPKPLAPPLLSATVRCPAIAHVRGRPRV